MEIDLDNRRQEEDNRGEGIDLDNRHREEEIDLDNRHQ